MENKRRHAKKGACTDPEVGEWNLDGYKYEYLKGAERSRFEQHVRACAHCAQALAELVPCTHPKIGRGIDAYVLGGRPEVGRAAFEEHAFACPGCLQHLAGCAALMRIASEEPELIELWFAEEPLFLGHRAEELDGSASAPGSQGRASSAPRREDYIQAANKLQRTIRKEPDHAGTLLALGYCYLKLDHPTAAIDPLKRCLAVCGPRYKATAHWRLANAYLGAGQRDAALRELDHVIGGDRAHTNEAQILRDAIRRALQLTGKAPVRLKPSDRTKASKCTDPKVGEEWIDQYVFRGLKGERLAQFEAHLSECAFCARQVEEDSDLTPYIEALWRHPEILEPRAERRRAGRGGRRPRGINGWPWPWDSFLLS